MPLRQVQRRIYTKLGIALVAVSFCFFSVFVWLVHKGQVEQLDDSARLWLELTLRAGESIEEQRELLLARENLGEWQGRADVFLYSRAKLVFSSLETGVSPRLLDELRLSRLVPVTRDGYCYWFDSEKPDAEGGAIEAVVRFDKPSAWKFLSNRYGVLFLLGGCFSLSIASCVFYLQSRYVFRPLSSLLARIERRVESFSGTLPTRRNRTDEVERLGSRFDELVVALERQGRELRFRNAESRHLLDALPAYVWYKDDKNNVIRANQAAADSVGLTVEELEGMPCSDIFPDEAEAYFRDDKEVIESGKAKLGYVESYSPKGGPSRTIRTDKIPYLDEQGEITGVVVLVTDITELVDLQEEREASDRLIRRLVEIGNWESSGVRERIAAGLKDTCETLGLKTGILSEISGESYTVREVHDERGMVSAGDTFHLNDVYCQFVLMTGRSIASNHLGDTSWGQMECYKSLQLESYIASPIRLEGEITGTINFSSPDIRPKPFSQFEIDAVQLLSNWVEGLLRQEEAVDQLNRQKVELRLILDTTPSQIWFKDSNNRILRANRAAASYLGLTVGEVEGKLASELLPIEATRSFEEDKLVLETGTPLIGRIHSTITRGNRKAWFRYDKLPYQLDDERRGVITAVSDITELVDSETAAKEADERFRAAVEESPVGMLIVDSELRVVMLNNEAERIFGKAREQLLWKSIDGLLGSRVATALDCILEADERVDDQVRIGAEGDLAISNGGKSDVPVEIIFSPYSLSDDSYVMMSIFDIAARIESQRALHDSEQRFQLAAKGASVGIWDWCNIEEEEEWWSPRFYELLGYEPEELEPSIGSFKSLLHPDDLRPTFLAVEKCFKDASPFAVDYRLQCKNGEYRWFLGSGMASFDDDGVARRMTGTIQDINDRKVAEEELSKVVGNLKRANEELSSFAFLSSHDLQEPLRTISSFLNLLKDRYGESLDRDANEYMDFTLVAVDRMQNMIRSLLSYCSIGPQRPESLFSLNGAIEMGIRDLAKRIEERGVEISVPDQLTELYGDVGQISLVFQNLLSNAIKFNRSSFPKIEIGWHTVSAADIAREGLDASDYTVVSVADNGIGIRDMYHKKIFSIFRKLHPSDEYEGSGIGLSLVQKIMQQHDGFVWLESEEGKGSCFFLAFPNQQGR